MSIRSTNPASGELLQYYEATSDEAISTLLGRAAEAHRAWKALAFDDRASRMRAVAEQLRTKKDALARLITTEMGKLIGEAEGEVDKCAWVCDYYADNGEKFLTDDAIESDASRSLVAYQPLGTVLAVMPWNFPLWQVFRFAAPGLMAGNVGLLKHASNVSGSALKIKSADNFSLTSWSNRLTPFCCEYGLFGADKESHQHGDGHFEGKEELGPDRNTP